MKRNWMLWPGPLSPKRAYARLPWRECSRAGFARQRGGKRRDDDNVTYSSQRSENLTCRGEISRKIEVSTGHATPAGDMLACPRRVCYKFLTRFGPTTSAFHQFSCARNQLQAGVLRSRSGRKDREPAMDLRPHWAKSEGQDGFPGDGDGPDAVF